MPLPLKLVAWLALPICMTLVLLGRTVPPPEPPTESIASFEEASAPPTEPEFVEVIDLSSAFEPSRSSVSEVASENDLTPVGPASEASGGFGRLWKSWRAGYDWGRAVVDR